MRHTWSALRTILFRGIIASSIAVLVISGGPAYALTVDQINALNSGIDYFNTEADCGDLATDPAGTTILSGDDSLHQAFNFFISKGLSGRSTSAVLGNLMEESHLDPTIIQGGGSTTNPATVTGQVGWGIAQWTPGAKVIGIAQNLHISGPIYDLATQLNIVWAEMTGTAPTGYQNVAAGLQQQSTLEDATSFFQVNFESGTNQSARLNQAEIIWNNLGATAQASTNGTVTTTPTSGGTLAPANTSTSCDSNITTASTSANSQDIIWLDYGSTGTQEFGGLCDGCKDPMTGAAETWISGQCSQASLAEVLNAYRQGTTLKGQTYKGISKAPSSTGGIYYKTIDVERLSYELGIWQGYFTFNNGMKAAWQAEADLFNMNMAFYSSDQTNAAAYKISNDDTSLDKFVQIANAGNPVIVDAPNHWLVIIGGDATHVDLLDSSIHDNTWASAGTLDSTTINRSATAYHTAGIYDNGKAMEVTRDEFLHGLSGFQDYWGGSASGGTQNGGYQDYPVAVVLTPKTGASTTL